VRLAASRRSNAALSSSESAGRPLARRPWSASSLSLLAKPAAISPADERPVCNGHAQRGALPEKDDTRVGHFVQLHGRRVKEASTRSDRAGK